MHGGGTHGAAVCGAPQRGAGTVARHETFVPQSSAWGVEAQVDWYEAYADLDGERVKLQVFEMRSMASGAAYHRAYLRATQQAFWKPTSWRFITSAASSVAFATIIFRAR